MARFFVDESLPTLLAEELVKGGHEAVHAHEAGLQGAPDEQIYQRADAMGAILLTRDLGFADVRHFPGGIGIVVVRIRGRILVRELVRRVLDLLRGFSRELEELEGKVLILEPGRSRMRKKLEG
jgi:predicted nuclease of predicted toxin-antitoxin system